MKNVFKILIGLMVACLAVGAVSAATTTINQFNYGVIGGSSDVTHVAVNGAVGSNGAISQVNNLYTYDSHGITLVGANGLLDSRGTITQQNVGTVESNTIDSVQVLANIGVDESGTTTQGNSGIVYNTVGSTQVLGNIDDPTLHYDLNGLILNYL
jgi:hypothetical protein